MIVQASCYCMNHESFKRTLEACMEACARCSSACAREDESYFLIRCRKLNHTAVVICTLVLKAMTGNSVLLSQVCRLCIEICSTCAEECEKFSHLEHCNISAAACRKSIAECRVYLAIKPEEYHIALTQEQYEFHL